AVPDICGSYQGNATADNFNECYGEFKSGMTCDGWAEHALGEGWTNNGPEGYPVYSDKIPVSFSRLHRGDEYLPRSIYRLRYNGTDVADIGMVEGDTQFDPALFELYKTEDDDVPVVIDYITLNGVRMTDTVTASDYGQLNFSAVVDNSFCRDYLQPAVDEGNRIYAQGERIYSPSSLTALREAIDDAQQALDEAYMSVTNDWGADLILAIVNVEMAKFVYMISFSASEGLTPCVERDGEWVESSFYGGTLSETVRLKALKQEGYRFLNWTDSAGNIISEEAEFDYLINRTTTLTANAIREDSFTFTYQDTYGKIYKVQEAADFSEIAYPVEAGQAGLRVGFTVKEWTSDYSGEMTGPVDCDVVFTASLQKTSALFTVHSEAAGVEEEVELKTAKIYTRTAPDTYEGNDFSYWKDSATGKVLSYSPEVSFSVYSDMDIEAVYGAAAEGVTCANLWTAPSSAGKISFVGQVVRGADFASEEMHGVLLLRSDDPVNELVLDTQDVIVGKALGYSARTGTFIINKKNVSAGDTWYGRAFVIYRDNDGEQQVAYSDIKSVTL
ncbi:MAG: hypothetical protein ILO36_02965, partial [Abditibacteriota bacterium]|nr:hypothetical protein [Abditibacteriota bacterium]